MLFTRRLCSVRESEHSRERNLESTNGENQRFNALEIRYCGPLESLDDSADALDFQFVIGESVGEEKGGGREEL